MEIIAQDQTAHSYWNYIIATIYEKEIIKIGVFKFHCNEKLNLLRMEYIIIANGENKF